MIADLIEPTSGTVLVNGKSAKQSRLDQDYGMAFQQSGLFEWRTVRKNIELPLELKGWGKAKRQSRAEEMLDLVQLSDFGSHMPWQLSGGMQQRVAIARALASHPPLLLMDEPFGALDEMTREHMQAELLRICGAAQTTVVFVTHSIPEAVYLSSRVVVLSPRPGRITDIIDVDLGAERDEDTREAIVAGGVERGWTKDMLLMSWGPPYDKQKLVGRDATRSERYIYRFEEQQDGRILLWTEGSKTAYKAARLFTKDVFIDDDRITSVEERNGWD